MFLHQQKNEENRHHINLFLGYIEAFVFFLYIVCILEFGLPCRQYTQWAGTSSQSINFVLYEFFQISASATVLKNLWKKLV